MKIITCTGYGNSGSSAATDFFSEFSNVQLVPHDFECTFIHEADGLYDLEKAIEEGHRFKVDLAVKRFIALSRRLQNSQYYKFFNGLFFNLTIEFLEKAIGLKWNGWWHRVFDEENLSLTKKIKFEEVANNFNKELKNEKYLLYENDTWLPSYLPFTDMYYECDLYKFRVEAKNYIYSLLKTLNKNEKDYLLIDQLVPPINTEKYLHYFDEIYVIIVDRDPRDYYMLNNLFWASRYIPSHNIDQFIYWYKKTRGLYRKLENVKRIYLEDFVYRYDKISSELINFVDEKKELHTNKLTKLIPENSKKNTGIYRKYINYSNEINKINYELKDFLFDFDSYLLKDEYNKEFINLPIIDLINKYDDYVISNKKSIKYYIILIKKVLKKIIHGIGKCKKN